MIVLKSPRVLSHSMAEESEKNIFSKDSVIENDRLIFLYV